MHFDDGSHCHWTYRVGPYTSLWRWPTRGEAQEASEVHNDDGPTPEVFQIHSPTECRCFPPQTPQEDPA